MKMWTVAATAASVMCVSGARAHASNLGSAPSEKDLAPAVEAFLADHGDLCLAWYTWPRELTAEQQHSGLNEAVQLPVLERLGLVKSTEVSGGSGPTRRYSLTAKGRRYYLQKKRITLGLHGEPQAHDADFCVAQLSLDKVIKWTPPEPLHGHVETLVKYTYRIKPADWMSDDEARKVFPMVDRIIRGAGKLEMTATVQQQNGRWVPVPPGQ
jgi:DNA-binding PadR family transcriptional regulator